MKFFLYLRSFNFKTNNLNEPRTAIEEDTILTLDPDSGKVLSSWGKGMFYMPHGLTIDADGNIYVTDVGLHQVMRVGQRIRLDITFHMFQIHFCCTPFLNICKRNATYSS